MQQKRFIIDAPKHKNTQNRQLVAKKQKNNPMKVTGKLLIQKKDKKM